MVGIPAYPWQPEPVTSWSEERVKDLLNTILPEHAYVDNGRWAFLKGLELDRYYPALKLAVEVNGYHHHITGSRQQANDRKKRMLCYRNGIRLFIVEVGEHGVSTKALLTLRHRTLAYVASGRLGPSIAAHRRAARDRKKRKRAAARLAGESA